MGPSTQTWTGHPPWMASFCARPAPLARSSARGMAWPATRRGVSARRVCFRVNQFRGWVQWECQIFTHHFGGVVLGLVSSTHHFPGAFCLRGGVNDRQEVLMGAATWGPAFLGFPLSSTRKIPVHLEGRLCDVPPAQTCMVVVPFLGFL